MDMNVSEILSGFIIAIVALISIFFSALPNLSRRSVFFAVTVDPEFPATPGARHIVHSFRVIVILNAVIAIALTALSIWMRIFWLAPIGVFWLTIGNYFAFLHGRKSTMPFRVKPSGVRAAEVVPRPEHMPGGWFAQLGPFSLLFIVAMILRQHWDSIPERFPIHWDAAGRANGFSDRTFSGVYGTLIFGAVMCAVLALIALAVVKRTRRVELTGPGGTRDSRIRRYNAIILVCVEYLLAFVFAGTALLPLRQSFSRQPFDLPAGGVAWTLFGSLLFVAFIILMLMRAARTPKEEASPDAASRETLDRVIGDATPDSRWIGGMLYFNRDDPALFVEKRFGLGYTLNFGHKIAWIVLAVLIAIPLLSALVLPSHK